MPAYKPFHKLVYLLRLIGSFTRVGDAKMVAIIYVQVL